MSSPYLYNEIFYIRSRNEAEIVTIQKDTALIPLIQQLALEVNKDVLKNNEVIRQVQDTLERHEAILTVVARRSIDHEATLELITKRAIDREAKLKQML